MNKKKELKMVLIFKEPRDYEEYRSFFANMCIAYSKNAYFNSRDSTIYLRNNSIIKITLRSDREDLSQFDILYRVGRHENDESLIGLINMIFKNDDIDFYELMNQKYDEDEDKLYVYFTMSENEFYHFINHELLGRYSLLNSHIAKLYDGVVKKLKQELYKVKEKYWMHGYCCMIPIENIRILIVKDEYTMYKAFDNMSLCFKGRRKHENVVDTDIVLSDFLKAMRI